MQQAVPGNLMQPRPTPGNARQRQATPGKPRQPQAAPGKPVVKKAMAGRTPLFNAVVATAVLGSTYVAFFFQGHVRAAFTPVFEAVEYSRAAYIICFLVLLAMPEPSPFVVLTSALVVFSPPSAAWWAWAMSSKEDYQKVIWMMTTVFMVTYWTNGLFLFALEHYCPQRLQQYRVQKDIRPHSRPATGKLIRNLLFNTCLVPAIALVIGLNINLQPSDFEIPGPFEMTLSTLVGVVVNEILFFYGHWMMHANKFLYGNVHKVHHEFKAPCALAAIYCHPLELVVSDFVPLAAGIVMFNTNLYSAAVFTTFAVLGTQTHHCGFRWPWIAGHGHQPDFHDYHHERFNCNYGNIGFLDAIHGTGQGTRRDNEIAAKGSGKEAAKAA